MIVTCSQETHLRTLAPPLKPLSVLPTKSCAGLTMVQEINDLSCHSLAFDFSEELAGVGKERLPGPLWRQSSHLGAQQIAGAKGGLGTKGLLHLPVEALFPHSMLSEGNKALLFHAAPTGRRQQRAYSDRGHRLPRERQQNKQ